MTHEQKPESAEFRTREAQVARMCQLFHFPDAGALNVTSASVITRNILEAEARGAANALAEQRRKDAEGAEPVGYTSQIDLDRVRKGKSGDIYGSQKWEGSDDAVFTIPLYARPANVAALIAEAVAAARERCAKMCDALAQNISHERGSLPDWETGEVTLDELSQVEFEAFERVAAAIREGGENG